MVGRSGWGAKRGWARAAAGRGAAALSHVRGDPPSFPPGPALPSSPRGPVVPRVVATSLPPLLLPVGGRVGGRRAARAPGRRVQPRGGSGAGGTSGPPVGRGARTLGGAGGGGDSGRDPLPPFGPGVPLYRGTQSLRVQWASLSSDGRLGHLLRQENSLPMTIDEKYFLNNGVRKKKDSRQLDR